MTSYNSQVKKHVVTAGARRRPRRSTKTAYKHVPHCEKPPHLVARRNARERRRVETVNNAFLRLRRHVPMETRNKRLSKVKTLRYAIEYIRQLTFMINEYDKQFGSPCINFGQTVSLEVVAYHQQRDRACSVHGMREEFTSNGSWCQFGWCTRMWHHFLITAVERFYSSAKIRYLVLVLCFLSPMQQQWQQRFAPKLTFLYWDHLHDKRSNVSATLVMLIRTYKAYSSTSWHARNLGTPMTRYGNHPCLFLYWFPMQRIIKSNIEGQWILKRALKSNIVSPWRFLLLQPCLGTQYKDKSHFTEPAMII